MKYLILASLAIGPSAIRIDQRNAHATMQESHPEPTELAECKECHTHIHLNDDKTPWDDDI